jgi:hypothetical protein
VPAHLKGYEKGDVSKHAAELGLFLLWFPY